MKTKLIIFGMTGDLSKRKLLPALRDIYATGEYEELTVIGVSRREVDVPELLRSSLGSDELAPKFGMVTMDLENGKDYLRLKDEIALQDDEQAIIYLSVPPSASTDIVEFLGQAGLNTDNVKLLFEKPFGFDLSSAREYLERVGKYFKEERIYRIDHYAAKEIAQQLIALRADAETHQHHWSNESIAAVEVIASETIGVEDRAVFYEQTGALRDFLQGHLLQIMALVLMPVEPDFDLETLPARRAGALKFIQPANPEKAARAQYENYGEEVGNPGSLTETFAQLELESDDPKWAGVMLHVTTGKALDKKRSFVAVHYKDGSEEIFDEDKAQPTDGRKLDAYERVLLEAIAGHKSLFTSADEVLRAWEIVAPIQETWAMDDQPLKLYRSGSTIEEVLS